MKLSNCYYLVLILVLAKWIQQNSQKIIANNSFHNLLKPVLFRFLVPSGRLCFFSENGQILDSWQILDFYTSKTVALKARTKSMGISNIGKI